MVSLVLNPKKVEYILGIEKLWGGLAVRRCMSNSGLLEGQAQMGKREEIRLDK